MWIKEKKHGYMWIFDFLGKHYEKRSKWTGKNSNSRACASWRTRAKKICLILGKKIMIFKLELSPQNFHYDVLYPLYSGIH